MDSKAPLNSKDFVTLLDVNPSRSVEIFKKLIDSKEGDLELEIVSEGEFNRRIKSNPAMEGCESIFYSKSSRPGKKGKIVMKEMPIVNLSTDEGMEKAFRAVLVRVVGLLHEGVQHHRQATGRHEAIHEQDEAFNFLPGKIGRSERLATEIMAFLEEERWHAKNYSIQKWLVARRLGESLPLHFRNMNDHYYFGSVNRGLIEQVREPRPSSLGLAPRTRKR